MSLGVLSPRRSLGADASKYPWQVFSQDTLALQNATNLALQAAGFCHIPPTGILDGRLCGARNYLTNHSIEHFNREMLFSNPSECSAHPDELMMPIPGCFEPTELKAGQKIGTVVTTNEWIVLGGAASLVLAAVIAAKRKG